MAMPARVRGRHSFSWVAADEAYGQVKYLRVWLEQRDAAHVPATVTTRGDEQRS
jgi:hypothetical protein